MRRRTALIVLAGALALSPAGHAARADDARVSYVSPDHVYIDAGTAAGIAPGDTLAVTRDGNPVCSLVVEFAAQRSASCVILESGAGAPGTSPPGTPPGAPPAASPAAPAGGLVRVGDRATVRARIPAGPAAVPADSAAAPRRERVIPGGPDTTLAGDRRGPRTWGAAGAEYVRMSGSTGGRGSAQAMLRLHLTVIGLADHYTFNVHARARRDDRFGAATPGLPSSEWRDQVYALSLRRDPEGGGFGMEVGRLSLPVADAGGIMDGVVLRAIAGQGRDMGAFFGTDPIWGLAAAGSPARKAGAFVSFRGAPGARLRLYAAAAAVGQYASGSIDREFISLTGSVSAGNRWFLSPDAVIDLNRRWRRTAAGQTFSLSRLDLAASFAPPGPFSVRAGYDRDRRARTFDSRATPDSLFEGSSRESWRAAASFRSGPWAVGASAGTRRGSGDPSRAWFWSGDLRRAGVIDRSTSVTVRSGGFRGPLSRGVNPAIEIRRDSAGRAPRLGLAAGLYRYTAPGLASAESNRWIRLDAGLDLAHAYRLDLEYQHAGGGALPAHTARASFERRF